MDKKTRLITACLTGPVVFWTLLVNLVSPLEGAPLQNAVSPPIDLIDISSVEPDLTLPPLVSSAPLRAGRRFKEVLPTLQDIEIDLEMSVRERSPMENSAMASPEAKNSSGSVCRLLTKSKRKTPLHGGATHPTIIHDRP